MEIKTISDKEIRDTIKREFKDEERVFNMQSFFGRETVVRIVKYFLNDTIN